MKKLLNLYNHFEETLLFSALAFSVALIFTQVVMRYVFRDSLSWSEELARYLFVWYTWVGTSYAVAQHRHIRIEILSDFLKGGAKVFLEKMVLVIWAAFSFFLTWEGFQTVKIIAERGQTSAALEIPMYFAYAAVPVGACLMAVRLVIELFSKQNSTDGEVR